MRKWMPVLLTGCPKGLSFGCAAAAALAAGLTACGSDMAYRPSAQILPSNIKKISIRHALNKTQQFGLEDKFTMRVRDEFLRDGRYPIVPASDADGILWITSAIPLHAPAATSSPVPQTGSSWTCSSGPGRGILALGGEELEGITLYPASICPSKSRRLGGHLGHPPRGVVKRVSRLGP